MRSGMEDTYSQPPTGYRCSACGGIAVVDLDGIYLCADDAIRSMGADPEYACDRPVGAGSRPAVLVDPTDVGEVRSTRTADVRRMSLSERCQSPTRRRRAYGHTYH